MKNNLNSMSKLFNLNSCITTSLLPHFFFFFCAMDLLEALLGSAIESKRLNWFEYKGFP